MADTPRKRQPRMPIEARRDQILDAALRLIIEHGYTAANMEAIAREANIAKPRVYTAYPTRGELLRALLQREETRIVGALASAMPPLDADIAFESTLTAAATNLFAAVAREPAPWRLLMVPAVEAPPEVLAHVEAGRAFALAQLRSLVKIGAADTSGVSGVDVELAARALLAIGEQAVRDLLTDPDQFTVERYSDFVRTSVARLTG
jgi:AcrR family transcriptional regulator